MVSGVLKRLASVAILLVGSRLSFRLIGEIGRFDGEAIGATPLAATDCMNFGNPQRPGIMGQFVGCIEGMAEACAALDFPIVSGNVSLYNETKAEDGSGSAILPTPAIGGVGLVEDWTKSATLAFKATGDWVFVLGDGGGHLGQSLWLREIHGREEGPPPPVDLAAERAAGAFVRRAIAEGLVSAVHDVSDGGILVAAAEMALAGGIGLSIEGEWFDGHAAARLFGWTEGLARLRAMQARGALTDVKLSFARGALDAPVTYTTEAKLDAVALPAWRRDRVAEDAASGRRGA